MHFVKWANKIFEIFGGFNGEEIQFLSAQLGMRGHTNSYTIAKKW